MKVGEAIAEILKREGVELLLAYPVNHVIEAAAAAGIRPIIVRQERLAHVSPNFNSVTSMRSVAKLAEPVTSPAEIPNIFRRAFSRLRNGRGGPAVVEIASDLFTEDLPHPLAYEPTIRASYGPDRADVVRAATALVEAKAPVIYAGQGSF